MEQGTPDIVAGNSAGKFLHSRRVECSVVDGLRLKNDRPEVLLRFGSIKQVREDGAVGPDLSKVCANSGFSRGGEVLRVL